MSGKLLWGGLTLIMAQTLIHPLAEPVGMALMIVGYILYLLDR